MVIVILIPVFELDSGCSFWFGLRLVRRVVQPIRGRIREVYLFHAIRWSRVLHHRVSGLVPYPDRAQAFGHNRRNRRLVRRSRKRYCGVDAAGFERRIGERGFRSYSLVDSPDLRRLDPVLYFRGQENAFVGCYPDRFDYQRSIEVFHDSRYPPDVWFCVLY